MSNNLAAALYYRNKMGFSIIPIREDGSKKPYIKWIHYQTNKPSDVEIRGWFNKWPNANIGIITGKINMLTVFDFDWHRLTEAEQAEVKEAFPDVGTPVALSPNGGEHRYFEYQAGVPNKADIMKGVDTRNDGGYIIAPPSKNGNGNYTWHERAKIGIVSLRAIPDSYNNIINSLSLYAYRDVSIYRDIDSHKPQGTTKTTTNHKLFKKGNRDESIFHLANHLIKGRMPEAEVQYILEMIAEKVCVPPFPREEVELKVKSAIKRYRGKARTIAQEVRDWVITTDGYFLTTECHSELQITTKDDKKAANMELLRLVEQGILSKHGEKRGSYRLIEKTKWEDWMNTDIDPISIEMPFGMERYVKTYPGDVIVIAGVKNAGKTAMALEFIRLNMRSFPCYYHSSELVKQTFKLRVSKCKDTPLDKWKDVKMSQGLSMATAKDKVVTDALNVFDYIEGDEGEFYKIPSTMAKIHRELGDGVGIICLQKPTGRNFARGGEGTKDKASLYLTIDKDYPYHIMRIDECKVFDEDEGNPTGFIMRYKIVDGINLVACDSLGPERDITI